jgi:hypothetical protein
MLTQQQQFVNTIIYYFRLSQNNATGHNYSDPGNLSYLYIHSTLKRIMHMDDYKFQ